MYSWQFYVECTLKKPKNCLLALFPSRAFSQAGNWAVYSEIGWGLRKEKFIANMNQGVTGSWGKGAQALEKADSLVLVPTPWASLDHSWWLLNGWSMRGPLDKGTEHTKIGRDACSCQLYFLFYFFVLSSLRFCGVLLQVLRVAKVT